MSKETEEQQEERKLRLDMTPSEWGMMMAVVMIYRDHYANPRQKEMLDGLMKRVEAIEKK